MAANEIIKKMIIKNNDLFKSLELEVVPVFSNDNKCNMSSITEDENVYVNSSCNDEYNEEIFAFRNWAKVSSILGMYSDDLSIKVDYEYDADSGKNCPSVMNFKSPLVKVKHYLQSYKYYIAQEKNNAMYKKKKFKLANLTDSNIEFEKDSLKQLSKATSILDDKQFILKVENGELYAIIGDESKSVDNIKIKVGNTDIEDFTETNLLSFDYFNRIYKSYEKMSGTNYIKVYKDKIIFTNTDDNISVTTILRAKNN